MRRQLEDWVLRGRYAILAVVAVVTAVAWWSWSHLEIQNTPETWFAGSGERYEQFQRYQERFGMNETAFVVVRTGDVFAPDTLRKIDRLTRELEATPSIDRVTSLTNIEHIRATPEAIEIAPLVPEGEFDEAFTARLREKVLADRFYPGTIVSSDGTTTAVIVEVTDLSAANTAAALEALETATATLSGPGIETHVAGWMVVNEEMNRLAQDDMQRGFPTSVAILGTCLALFFRSLRAVGIVVLAVLLAITWTMGTFTATGLPGTLVAASTTPGILFALCFATAVHVVARFREENERTPEPGRAMRIALRRIAPVVVLTSVTTAIGFGSLVIAELPPLRHLGIFAAYGMGVTCVICLTVVPIALVSFRGRGTAKPQPWLERALSRVADWNVQRPGVILMAAAGLTLFGVTGAFLLRPQGTNLNYLPRSSPVLEAMRFIEKHFGPAGVTEVMITGPEGIFQTPGAARTVARVQEILEAQPSIGRSFAYTDLLRRMNEALNDGDPEAYRIPDTKASVAQELFLYETSGGETLPEYLDVTGHDAARVTSRMSAFISIEEWAGLYDELGRRFDELAREDGLPLRFQIAGDSPLWLYMNLSLKETMGKSFLLALAGVSIMMMALLRSVRWGLVAMIPNVFPVVVGVGAMGWVGVELDFATVMVAAIALGIAVDDTIHYLARYRQELADVASAEEAMRQTLATVGKAMVTTSVVLFLGIGSMVFSNFPPHQFFAATLSLTMLLALASDLFLLPVLLHLADREAVVLPVSAGPAAPTPADSESSAPMSFRERFPNVPAGRSARNRDSR